MCNKLEFCPFCGAKEGDEAGGPYVAERKDEQKFPPLYWIACLNCGAASCVIPEDKQMAIAAWNRRA